MIFPVHIGSRFKVGVATLCTGRRIATTLLILILVLPLLASAQETIHLEVSKNGKWYELNDSVLVVADMETGTVERMPVDGWIQSEEYRSNIRQSVVAAADSSILVWDRSVGSVSIFSLQDYSFETHRRLPSQNQFDHAADVSSSGSLYVFGGYGNYRLKNMLLAYDESKHSWIELPPYSDEAPPARIYATLIADDANDQLYLMGGLGASSDPPRDADTELTDAWAYSLSRETWRPVGMNEWLKCSLNEYRFAPFRPTTIGRTGLVPVFVPLDCLSDQPDFEAGLYVWNPDKNAAWLVADQASAYSFGTRPTAWAMGPDESKLRLYYPIGEYQWRNRDFSISRPQVVISLSTPYAIPTFVWLLGIALVVASVFGLHSRRVSFSILEAENQIAVRKGFSTRYVSVSKNAVMIAAHAAALEAPTIKPFRREDLEAAVDGLYFDADTARNAVNRAINELNKVAEEATGQELFTKMSDPSDGRRSLYLLSQTLV